MTAEASRTTKFVLFQDDAGEYRWTFVARNGEEIAVPGEGYDRRDSCEAAIERVQEYAPEAGIVDETTSGSEETDSEAWFELYLDEAEEYRWRLQSPNGEIIAVSSEGYDNRGGCRRGIELLKNQSSHAEIVDETEEDDDSGGFVPPVGPSDPSKGRFA